VIIRQFTVHFGQFIFIIYVSEHQLSHAVPYYVYYTCQLGSYVIETEWWRHCPYFKWVSCISGTTTQTHDAEPDLTARYYSNSI